MKAVPGPRWIATAAYLGLAALQPVWYLLWAPPSVVPGLWAAGIGLAPLLVLLPGVLADRPRAWVWACYLGLPYFIHGAVEAWAEPAHRDPGLTEAGLTVLLFASVMLRLRHPRRPG